MGGFSSFFGGDREKTTQGQTSSYDIPDWYMNAMQGNVDRAWDISNQPFERYPTEDRFAPLTEDEQAAFEQFRSVGEAGTPYLTQGADLLSRAGERGFAGPTTENVQSFMNPFQQAYTDVRKREAVDDFDATRRNILSQSAHSDAFGGSGRYILEAKNYENIQDRWGDIQKEDMAENFYNAQNQFNNANQLGMAAGQALGGMGQTMQDYYLQGANALLGSGQQQRAFQQQQRDFDFSEFMREYQQPYEQVGFMSNVLSGVPLQMFPYHSSGMSATGTQGNVVGNLVGLALGGFGGFKEGGEVKRYAEGGEVKADVQDPVGSQNPFEGWLKNIINSIKSSNQVSPEGMPQANPASGSSSSSSGGLMDSIQGGMNLAQGLGDLIGNFAVGDMVLVKEGGEIKNPFDYKCGGKVHKYQDGGEVDVPATWFLPLGEEDRVYEESLNTPTTQFQKDVGLDGVNLDNYNVFNPIVREAMMKEASEKVSNMVGGVSDYFTKDISSETTEKKEAEILDGTSDYMQAQKTGKTPYSVSTAQPELFDAIVKGINSKAKADKEAAARLERERMRRFSDAMMNPDGGGLGRRLLSGMRAYHNTEKALEQEAMARQAHQAKTAQMMSEAQKHQAQAMKSEMESKQLYKEMSEKMKFGGKLTNTEVIDYASKIIENSILAGMPMDNPTKLIQDVANKLLAIGVPKAQVEAIYGDLLYSSTVGAGPGEGFVIQ